MDELSFPILIGLLGLGLALLAVEAFVVPGLGVPGLVGAGMIVVAVVFAFAYHGAGGGVGALVVAGAVLALMAAVAKITLGQRLFLAETMAAVPLADEDLVHLVGREGVAITILRPSGAARIDGERVDVTTTSDYVEAGTPVVVVEVTGNRVTVQPKSA